MRSGELTIIIAIVYRYMRSFCIKDSFLETFVCLYVKWVGKSLVPMLKMWTRTPSLDDKAYTILESGSAGQPTCRYDCAIIALKWISSELWRERRCRISLLNASVRVQPPGRVRDGWAPRRPPQLHVCFVLLVLFSLLTYFTLTLRWAPWPAEQFVDRPRWWNSMWWILNVNSGLQSDEKMDANLKLLPYFNAKLINTYKKKSREN